MPIMTDPEKAKKFVYELEWTEGLEYIYKEVQTIFAHLPYIYTQKPETDYFLEHIYADGKGYALYDPEKPLMQVINLPSTTHFKELGLFLKEFGLLMNLKYFQADPTIPAFKNVEHLFFGHRHHQLTSVASLIFPIAGCDENTLTSWPEYEDVDGYVPTDPERSGIYWSEYYWQTYQKNDNKYLYPDDVAACRYAFTDKPVLWNVKQWHEAVNLGNKHRVICNINFEDPKLTWEESIERVRSI